MAGAHDDALARVIASHSEDVPAFLELVANTLHRTTDFFAQPNWQAILADKFRPPATSAANTTSRFSMNSTVNSIPASPEPDIPVSQNRHQARRPHTSSSSGAPNAIPKPSSSPQLPAKFLLNRSHLEERVLAAKTPEPEPEALNPRHSSMSRYSFDIPETQAFPGGDDTIPETQAFVRPRSPATSRPPSLSVDDAFFFDAADDDACTFNETQSQMLPVSPPPTKAPAADLPADATLLDDDVDDELSALQWNDESVVATDISKSDQAAVRASTVTPDLDFDVVAKIDVGDELRKESGSVTPDLELDGAAVDKPPEPANETTTPSVHNDPHVFAIPAPPVMPDMLDECTQPFAPVKSNENNTIAVGLNDETQPFVLGRNDRPEPPAVFASALDLDDEDIFAMATQKMTVPNSVEADDDFYAMATQAMPDHCFAKPVFPSGNSSIVDRKRRTKKPLTLPKEPLQPVEKVPIVLVEKLPETLLENLRCYVADTQPMPVEDDVYGAATQRMDVGDEDVDDLYNQPTQAIPTKPPISAPKPIRRSTSEEVDTPDFDFIRMADPMKILEAEQAFREKCRQQPHKKLLFVDSSDEEEMANNSDHRTASAPLSTRATKSADGVKRRGDKNDAPGNASKSSAVASTSAQNMTTYESDLTSESTSKNIKKEPAPEPVRKASRRIAEKRRDTIASTDSGDSVAPKKRSRANKETTSEPDEGSIKGKRSEHKKKTSKTSEKRSTSSASSKGEQKMESSPSETKENFAQGKPVEIRRGRLRANNEDTMSHHNKKRSALHTSTTSETDETTKRNGCKSSREPSKSKSMHTLHTSPHSSLPDEHSRSSSSRHTSHSTLLRHPRILFTVIDPSPYVERIARMGGRIVQTPAECQVLVTDRVYRTYKFLCAIASGSHIVSESWLKACVERRQFVDVQDYVLRDERTEARFKFRLDKSLAAARKRPIFAGHSVYVTPSTKPPPHELKTIIKAAGGHCLLNMERAPHKHNTVVVVSDVADAHMWPKLRLDHPDVKIYNTEFLMMGVLQQQLPLKSYLFK